MGLFTKVRGTIETLWQLGLGGPQWKNNASVIEARNSADSGFVVTRTATPASENDAAVKMYADLDNEPAAPGTTYSNTITAGQVTQEVWKRTAGLTNLKTIDYTYTAGKVDTEVRKVYASDGATIVAQMTLTYSYTGPTVTGIVTTRDV